MTTFKFTLFDGSSGTYRTDKAKNEVDAMIELKSKYGLRLKSVTMVGKA